jgi:hypothetical protein
MRVCLARLRCAFRLSQPLDAFFPIQPCPGVSPGWRPRDSPFEGFILRQGWPRLSTGPHLPAVLPASAPVPARRNRNRKTRTRLPGFRPSPESNLSGRMSPSPPED